MPPNSAQPLSGSLRIFQFAGISVFVHWSWLIFAVFEVQFRANNYASQIWNAIEFLSVFAIVLIHEFGHSLACRSVGGKADRIVLWPLGGVAFVRPPQRPGAVLWSIAAGPLVNVVLVPITFGAHFFAVSQGLPDTYPDAARYLSDIKWINLLMLLFNLLPVYPLDGGQILHALLWFIIGRAKSLLVVSVIGLVVAGVAVLIMLYYEQIWLMVMAGFLAFQAYMGFRSARMMLRLEGIPDNAIPRCPNCGAIPPPASMAQCPNCSTRFDLFATRGSCPKCGAMFGTACPACGQQSMLVDWFRPTNRR